MIRILIFFSFGSLLGLFGRTYDPFVDCADVSLVLNVRDECGQSVSNASVAVSFSIAPEKGVLIKGLTNTNGLFSIDGKTISIVNIWVRKKGFYQTHIRKSVALRDAAAVVASRKWMEKPVTIDVLLKTMRHPIRTTFHYTEYKPYPATNHVMHLDLEKLDWCAPYGKGVHPDVSVVYQGFRDPRAWLHFSDNLFFEFPNCVDGFYRVKQFVPSDFPYDYEAQTNRVYEKKLKLLFSREVKRITHDTGLEEDEYLIYRVRSQTNACGQITSAHYGRIGPGLSQLLGLSLKSWFNPTPLDCNLEDNQD